MKNPLFQTVIEAIDGHRLLRITDEAGPRVIEPYLIFESASGDMLLHGWQRSGAFRKTPPPRWCNLHLEDLLEVSLLAERFPRPHRDYNPFGPHFHRVLYAIDIRGPVTRPSGAASRGVVRVRRRGPPGGRSATDPSRVRRRQ